MKTILILLFVFLSLSLQAQAGLENLKMEASHHLKQELVGELKQSIGLEEFTLSVMVEVDQKNLHKALGIPEQNGKNMHLPGLFIEGKEGSAHTGYSQASKEDILLNLKRVKINISYSQENYTQDFLIASLKKITAMNLPNLKDHQIEVTAVLGTAPYRKPNTKVSSQPVDVNLTPGPFQSFWDQNYKFILIAAGLVVFALSYFLTYSLKGGLGSLAEVIKSKTFSAGSNSSAGPSAATAKSQGPMAPAESGRDNFESYIQATEYLTTMISKDTKVFNELVILKLLVEDYTSLIILLDVLGKEKRDQFISNIDGDKKERFREFIVSQGHSVLKDEVFLKIEAVKMIKLVKVASLSPNELYEIVVNEFISSLNPAELAQLMKIADTAEKQFISGLMNSDQLALLIQNETISPDELDTESVKLSESEIIDLMIKSSAIRDGKKSAIRREKLESVYAQIETSKAEILADALGLEAHLRFEFLFTEFRDLGLKYLEGMNYEALSMLYPLLTEGMQKELLSSLPELLSERLALAKKKVNAESLKHKGDFYFYLRSLSNSQEVDMVPHLKLAA
jgi:hypothetical protein